MKNIRKVNHKSWALTLCLLFLVFNICGCNESVQTGGKTKKLLTQAEQIIIEGLIDEDPQIRTIAIEVVADTQRSNLMPRVQRLLLDDYVPVRFAAAVAVGDIRYSLSKKMVRGLLKVPDDNTKIAAAYALYKLGEKDRLEIIRQAISSNDQTVRANAASLLGKSGDKGQLELLYQVMRDENSEDKVRYQAAESIAMLGDERIFRKIWAILISVYADDRVLAIRAMGALGTKQAKDVLITKLDDDVLEVRLTAAEQLGILGESVGEPEVLDVFRNNLTAQMTAVDAERAKVRAALAIGRIRTSRLMDFLPQLLTDKSKFVRIAAAKAVLNVQNGK